MENKGITAKVRFEVLQRCGFRCVYCGKKPKNTLHIEHIIPKSRGGTDDPENLVAACEECNKGKGSQILSESAIESLYYILGQGNDPDEEETNRDILLTNAENLRRPIIIPTASISIGKAPKEPRNNIDLPLSLRLSGPQLIIGGHGTGKTNFLAIQFLQDYQSLSTRWIFDYDAKLFDTVIDHFSVNKGIAMIAGCSDEYIFKFFLGNNDVNESSWIEVLLRTISWAYALQGEAFPLPLAYPPKTLEEMDKITYDQFPPYVSVLFSSCFQGEAGDILNRMLAPDTTFIVKGSTQIQHSLYSMLLGDRLIAELIKRGQRVTPLHIYVDGFVHSVSCFFLESVLRHKGLGFTLALADSYENIARFRSLAPDMWFRLINEVDLRGSFFVFGAGKDNQDLAITIWNDVLPLMYSKKER